MPQVTLIKTARINMIGGSLQTFPPGQHIMSEDLAYSREVLASTRDGRVDAPDVPFDNPAPPPYYAQFGEANGWRWPEPPR
jgi:hypothetical protein